MILTGPEIKEQIRLGNIEIDPYVAEHVNQHSVDLTLGDTVITYAEKRPDGIGFQPPTELDAKKDNPVIGFGIHEDGLLLRPNRLYLLHTVERVHSKCFVPLLDGKSSIGRLGVWMHITAGYGDTGFNGQYTLEVACVYPTRIYAGMRIAQISFHEVKGEIEDYKLRGNYVGEAARGPVPSMSWRQFK